MKHCLRLENCHGAYSQHAKPARLGSQHIKPSCFCLPVLNGHGDQYLHEEDSCVLAKVCAQGLVLVRAMGGKYQRLHQLQESLRAKELALREELLRVALLYSAGGKIGEDINSGRG